MAFYFTTPRIGAQPLGNVQTTQSTAHRLMEEVMATDGTYGSTFMYVKASAAILQYDTVWVKITGFAAKITDTLAKTPGHVGFAQVAFAADEYGWVMRTGNPTVRLTSATEKNVALYVNASAGVLSGATASSEVLGIVAVTSVTTTVGAVACIASFPVVMRAASLTQI